LKRVVFKVMMEMEGQVVSKEMGMDSEGDLEWFVENPWVVNLNLCTGKDLKEIRIIQCTEVNLRVSGSPLYILSSEDRGA
jgi:hypothetical protein